ncbi:MAG: hypothetical protein IKJ74_01000 [Clostridia bacterium]|nr:hypothetical protein [Clostridia bacterium]
MRFPKKDGGHLSVLILAFFDRYGARTVPSSPSGRDGTCPNELRSSVS